jgi:hypothetical protein
VRGKRILEVIFCGVEGKISDKQFIVTHLLLMFDKTNRVLQTVPDHRVSNHQRTEFT